MTVAFLNRSSKQGAKSVVGPVTGIRYNITPAGTPVSALDADALLSLTEPPCCGTPVPFDAEVRSFGVHVPTVEQLKEVPEGLWDAKPIASAPKPKTGRTKKIHTEYEKPEEEEEVVVEVQDDVFDQEEVGDEQPEVNEIEED